MYTLTETKGATWIIIACVMALVGATLSTVWLRLLQHYASQIISVSIKVTSGALAVASIAVVTESGSIRGIVLVFSVFHTIV